MNLIKHVFIPIEKRNVDEWKEAWPENLSHYFDMLWLLDECYIEYCFYRM